jgi:choice-of-anchor B domain-containing protein
MNRHRIPIFTALALSVLAAPLGAQTLRSDADPARDLGYAASIAIDGDAILVGRTGQPSGLPINPTRPGGVHVFGRNASGEWAEAAAFSADGVAIGDDFGASLAIDGATLLVGAPRQSEARGAVYAFRRGADGSWSPAGRLTASDGAEGDRFGSKIVVSGDVALVSAPRRDRSSGAVYTFRRQGGVWTEAGILTLPDGSPDTRFGTELALEGDRLLVGATREERVGRVHLYRHDAAAGEWTHVTTLDPGEESASRFGFAITFVGQRIVVAAPATDRSRGAVFTFALEGDRATMIGTPLVVDEIEGGAFFGGSLAAAGTDLWVGAPGRENGSGGAYVFRWDEDARAWAPLGAFGPEGSAFQTAMGRALAAGADVAAVGLPGAAMFDGSVSVYTREASGEWTMDGRLEDARPGMEPIVGGQVDCSDGEAASFTCTDVDLLAFLPVSAIAPVGGSARGIMVNDVWGWTDAETGREYALVGRVEGTAFVDITDPYNPVYLGDLPLTEGASVNIWRDMKVYKNHVFIVADLAGEHGVQVFDLTRLRDVPDPPVRFEETAHYDGIASAHNIVINEETGFAYVVGSSSGGETCGGGLHMIDIRDPENPTFAGCFQDPSTGRAGTGYSHDAQCIVYHGPDEEHVGKEICFGANETALSIADVSDKENPVPLSTAAHPNFGYTHQGWINDEHTHFFIDDELDELTGKAERTRTIVWDVTDLDDPVLVTEFLGTTAASDHNLYIDGPYMYQSNYVSGLRIIDISDPANPEEVGWFDTVPIGENTPGFAGSWSNYPYFESGTIIVTSMREGLFLLKKREGLVP